MSIVTRTGDEGTTALLFNRRVSKTHLRVIACGCCDELNTAFGVVRAFCNDQFITEPLLLIQKELVALMGEIATDSADREKYREKHFASVDEKMVQRLTAQVYELEQNHQLNFDGWATPGATVPSALMEAARTTCRRAERAVVALKESGVELNAEILRYLNRLSDLCWLWARYLEKVH